MYLINILLKSYTETIIFPAVSRGHIFIIDEYNEQSCYVTFILCNNARILPFSNLHWISFTDNFYAVCSIYLVIQNGNF